jgi:hypothetical protein
VTLTAAGDETARKLSDLVHVPPPELLELSEDELVALREAAKKLPRLGRD